MRFVQSSRRLFWIVVLAEFHHVVRPGPSSVVSASHTPNFDSETAMPRGNVQGLSFRSRITVPYGPDLYQRDPPQSPDDQPYGGYGVSMGAAERIAYDHKHHFLYSMNQLGYVIVVDYLDPNHPVLTKLSFAVEDSELGSIEICPDQGMLVLSLEDLGLVNIYSLEDRSKPESEREPPRLIRSIDVGGQPKSLLINRDCTLIAVANEANAEKLQLGGVTILQGDFSSEDAPIDTRRILLDYDTWDDEYLLRRGLNMPITKNTLLYWDIHSHRADEFDFSEVLGSYRAAMFLTPEDLTWNSPDETELLVNMQANNGMLRINMTDFSPVSVAGYGLIDHNVVPLDLEADGRCSLRTYKSVFAMRNPDTVRAVLYNGKSYIITSNEDGGMDFGSLEESISSYDLFKGNSFGLEGVTPPDYLFEPINGTTTGDSHIFNAECAGPICLDEVSMSLGSNAIDYESDPSNPLFYRMVLFGGRGWSIFELSEDPDDLLKLVFDSGDTIERKGCEAFPWAHNSILDSQYAPIIGPNNTYFKYLTAEGETEELEELVENSNPNGGNGCFDQGDGTPGSCPMSKYVDAESTGAGPAIENVIIGEACGRLVAAMAAEESSVAMLFDITDLASPDLVSVFHLSPASQHKSLGLAYDDGELGDLDPESGVFLRAEDSPSGKAGILWAGALSGTVSWWEFDCKEEAPPPRGEAH